MGTIRQWLGLALMLTGSTTSTCANAELPPDSVTEADQWIQVTWCGIWREVITKDDGYLIIYDGIRLDAEQLPTEEVCYQSAKEGARSGVGQFAIPLDLRHRKFLEAYLSMQRKFSCKFVSHVSGQLQGFVLHEGRRIPLMSGGVLGGQCQ